MSTCRHRTTCLPGWNAAVQLAVALLIATALPAGAAEQPADERWKAFRETLSTGADRARLWRLGWATAHSAGLAHNVYVAGQSGSSDRRFDARVSTVKSLLALADLAMNPPPHAAAAGTMEALYEQRERQPVRALDEAQALMRETAAEERRRRSLRGQRGSIAVNLLAGAVIAFGDDRVGDGAINAASGLLVTALQTATEPATVSRYQRDRTARHRWTLSAGRAHALASLRLAW